MDSAKVLIKKMLAESNMKMLELNNILNEENKTNYNVSNLSQKVNNETIKYNDVLQIAKLLGYKISVTKE